MIPGLSQDPWIALILKRLVQKSSDDATAVVVATAAV